MQVSNMNNNFQNFAFYKRLIYINPSYGICLYLINLFLMIFNQIYKSMTKKFPKILFMEALPGL